MERLKNFLNKRFELKQKEWEQFSALLSRKEFPGKALILRKGEIERNLSFVESGSIRFYIPAEPNDLTFAFIFENEFVCAYDSFLTQQPCLYHAETLTNTVVWQLSYENLQMLYANLPTSNVFGRMLTEEIYLKKSNREISLLTKSAEERYLDLFLHRPNVIRTIPLQYIASYIGVTPQALSRIRRRIF